MDKPAAFFVELEGKIEESKKQLEEKNAQLEKRNQVLEKKIQVIEEDLKKSKKELEAKIENIRKELEMQKLENNDVMYCQSADISNSGPLKLDESGLKRHRISMTVVGVTPIAVHNFAYINDFQYSNPYTALPHYDLRGQVWVGKAHLGVTLFARRKPGAGYLYPVAAEKTRIILRVTARAPGTPKPAFVLNHGEERDITLNWQGEEVTDKSKKGGWWWADKSKNVEDGWWWVWWAGDVSHDTFIQHNAVSPAHQMVVDYDITVLEEK